MEPQGAKSTAPLPEPLRELLLMILGQHAAAVVATFVRLDLADRLADRPCSADEMAADAGIDPTGALRLLRAAAALRLVDQVDETTFGRNSHTDLLRRGPGSLRDIALAVTEPSCSRLLEMLPDAVAKGRSVATSALGTDIWTYRDAHPKARMAMTERLLDLDEAVLPAVRQHIDLTTLRTIVAVGGDQGRFLAGLLRHAPAARGILFDRPQVVASATRTMASWQLAERVRCIGGDFLEKVPAGGDLYVLKGVLHDQDDDAASWLLDSCYMAAPPHSRLLAVEGVLPVGCGHDPITQLIDINTLVTVNGRERTVAEIEDLFNGSGYVLESVTQLEPTAFRPVALFIGRRS
jgi:hypothetical protein